MFTGKASLASLQFIPFWDLDIGSSCAMGFSLGFCCMRGRVKGMGRCVMGFHCESVLLSTYGLSVLSLL